VSTLENRNKSYIEITAFTISGQYQEQQIPESPTFRSTCRNYFIQAIRISNNWFDSITLGPSGSYLGDPRLRNTSTLFTQRQIPLHTI